MDLSTFWFVTKSVQFIWAEVGRRRQSSSSTPPEMRARPSPTGCAEALGNEARSIEFASLRAFFVCPVVLPSRPPLGNLCATLFRQPVAIASYVYYWSIDVSFRWSA